MNSKALEMAITTLIVIVLGVTILIGLIYALTGGFKSLGSSTKPFIDTSSSTAIKQACSLSCENQDKLIFCCQEYNIENQKIKCSDSRLEVPCNLDCQNFQCSSN